MSQLQLLRNENRKLENTPPPSLMDISGVASRPAALLLPLGYLMLYESERQKEKRNNKNRKQTKRD
jgi:hypothetical protein